MIPHIAIRIQPVWHLAGTTVFARRRTGQAMKKLFRRLSTKRDPQERNPHRPPYKLNWASVSSNSLPASCTNPTFQEVQQNIALAPKQHDTLTVQQHAAPTGGGSFSSASWDTSAPDRPAKPLSPAQPQSAVQADTSALQPSSSKAMPSGSAVTSSSKLPSPVNLEHTAAQSSRNSSQQHEAASIYKSYSDLHDIMSSGTFDFSQHHLLSSAPGGDWLSVTEDQASDRLPDKPKSAETHQSRFSHPWETQPSERSLAPSQPASKPKQDKPSIPRSPTFSSPDACARPRSLPLYSGPSPMTAMQGQDRSPNHPIATPFATYSNKAMCRALDSTDLDSAMRANGQTPLPPLQHISFARQRSGKQHTLLDL